MLLAWILPSSVVAFLWVAFLDRDGGTLNALLHTPRPPGCSTTRWSPSSCSTPGAARRSRCCCSRRPWERCRPRSSRPPAWPGPARGQQLRDVVFPHIRGHVLTNTLLISLWTFNDFSPYLLTAGGPNHETETLPVFIYQRALRRRARLRLGDLADHARHQPGHRALLPPPAEGACHLMSTPGAVVRRIALLRLPRRSWPPSSRCRCCGWSSPRSTPTRADRQAAPTSPSTTSAGCRREPVRGLLAAELVLISRSARCCCVTALWRRSRPTRCRGCACPGRDVLLYGLLLLSSIVTGTAAMVPIFQLMFAARPDRRPLRRRRSC